MSKETMTRIMSAAVGLMFVAGAAAGGALAQEQEYETQQDTAQQEMQIDAPSGFQKASEVTGVPEFVPGLGVLFVKPENLPVGPYLAYNPDGKLMSTVLLVPTEAGTEPMPGQEQPLEQQQQQQEQEEGQEYEQEQEQGQIPGQQQGVDPSQVGQMEMEEEEVDHLEVRFNRGFAMATSGLDRPHYQVILWHVSSDEARELEQLGLAQEQTPEEAQAEEARREEEKRREEEARGEEYQAEREGEMGEQAGIPGMENIEPPSGYQPATQVAQIPEFVPGIGVLFVKPENVPMGPYLAYDQEGQLVSTILMVPTTEFAQAQQQMQDLKLEEKNVDHLEIRTSEGFDTSTSPLDQRHYQVILWHVSPEEAQNLMRFEGSR